MANIYTTTLENIPHEKLTASWNKAFSDYAANLEFTVDGFLSFMAQNGVRFEASIGAFDGGELVGIWMNGVRTVGDTLTAYDSGTAIWPEYRSLGISKMLAAKSSEVLKKLGVKEYILEVMRQNARAFNVYRKDGFVVTRNLTCLKLGGLLSGAPAIPDGFKIENGPVTEDAGKFLSLMEYRPSWQNSTDAILAVGEKMRLVTARTGSKVVGYGVIQVDRGRIPQIGFAKEHWNDNISEIVLKRLCELAPKGKDVAVINIDDRASRTLAFYRKFGFTELVLQYEMKKEMI